MPKSVREKKHPVYFALRAYQLLERLSDDDMADYLGITKRTYNDKVNGYSDFSPPQAMAIAKKLNRTQDEIFLT